MTMNNDTMNTEELSTAIRNTIDGMGSLPMWFDESFAKESIGIKVMDGFVIEDCMNGCTSRNSDSVAYLFIIRNENTGEHYAYDDYFIGTEAIKVIEPIAPTQARCKYIPADTDLIVGDGHIDYSSALIEPLIMLAYGKK